MIFGAWCDREYGFEYDEVREHGGLAWFPTFADSSSLTWEPNRNYFPSKLKRRKAREYPELGITSGIPIYELFALDAESVGWVSEPARFAGFWEEFEP
jgi:glucose-6-phosphate isomerase